MKKISLFALLSLLVIVLSLTGVGCDYSYGDEAIGAWFGVFIIICLAFFAIVGIFLLVVWILAIIDCARRTNKEFPDGGENAKTIWLIVLLVSWVVNLWWVAAIVYYFMVMKKKPLKR